MRLGEENLRVCEDEVRRRKPRVCKKSPVINYFLNILNLTQIKIENIKKKVISCNQNISYPISCRF